MVQRCGVFCSESDALRFRRALPSALRRLRYASSLSPLPRFLPVKMGGAGAVPPDSVPPDVPPDLVQTGTPACLLSSCSTGGPSALQLSWHEQWLDGMMADVVDKAVANAVERKQRDAASDYENFSRSRERTDCAATRSFELHFRS